MSGGWLAGATLMHAGDGTSCASNVINDAGIMRCAEHGYAVYGSGWWDTVPERCACHAGECLCVVACMAPGCSGVRHDSDGNALEADGTPVTGPIGHQKHLDAAERIDVAGRFREWVDAGRPPLTVDDTALCVAGVKDDCCEDGDGHGWRECLKPSRYIIERSDFDASFGELGGGAEACEEHLQEIVDGMIDGSSDKAEIRAVVTIRWNA